MTLDYRLPLAGSQSGPPPNAPPDNKTLPSGRAESPADRLIRRLTDGGYDPRPVGHGKWESRCPVHKGTRRNLSITETSDGTVLLRCHHIDEGGRNCPSGSVVAELGLELKDLFVHGIGSERGPGKSKPKTSASPTRAAKPKQVTLFDSPRDAATFLAKKLGDQTGCWVYRCILDDAVLAVYRFDGPGGKEYRPVSLDQVSGKWKIGDPEGQLPLYRLGEIAQATTVFILEGEKCVDLARTLGIVATTTAHGAQSPHKTDLAPLAGKDVVIVPDLGAPGEGYANAIGNLLSKLNPAPKVKVLRLPGLDEDGDDIEQWVGNRPGISAEGLKAELLSLAAAATRFAVADAEDLHIIPFPRSGEADGDGIKPNEAPDDPSRLARLFLDQRCRHEDGLTVRYWQGEFWEWTGAYRTVLTEDIKARLHGSIKAEFDRLNVEEVAAWGAEKDSAKDDFGPGKKPTKPKARKVTTGLAGNTVLALGGYAHLNPRTSAPSWLTDDEPFPAQDVLPTRNALVHLPGLVNGNPDAIRTPTPAFFGHYALDYDFRPDAPKPVRFFKFLDSIWPDDPESIQTLQDWFGHVLTPDTSFQKILMMIGPKRSGKGTLARLMRALIGPENTANPTLASLATNFGLSPLIGKPVAVIGDARLSGRVDIAQIVERLLSISGEDAQTIDRKHLPAITVKLPTRFVLISNELPRLSDASGAMTGRLILLRLTRSFYGEEDRRLTDELLEELPGILLWAIEGWKRLRDRGRFVQPAAGRTLIEEMEDLSSPVGAFIKDCCTIEPGADVLVSTLFAAWKAWCDERGRDKPGDEMVFGRNLRAVLPNLNTPYRRQDDGSRKRHYEGIRLNAPSREWL